MFYTFTPRSTLSRSRSLYTTTTPGRGLHGPRGRVRPFDCDPGSLLSPFSLAGSHFPWFRTGEHPRPRAFPVGSSCPLVSPDPSPSRFGDPDPTPWRALIGPRRHPPAPQPPGGKHRGGFDGTRFQIHPPFVPCPVARAASCAAPAETHAHTAPPRCRPRRRRPAHPYPRIQSMQI